MDLHRFWDGVVTSSSNQTRIKRCAALRNRQAFQRSQLPAGYVVSASRIADRRIIGAIPV